MAASRDLERIGSIEVDQDLEFQRKEWVFQRVGWALMALVLVAGGAGALGGMGPLTTGTTGEPGDALRVEHDRVGRHRAPSQMSIHVARGLPTDSTLAIWVDRAFVENTDIERITPEPKRSTLEAERVVYELELLDGNRGTEIVIDLEPVNSGMQRVRIGVLGGVAVEFSQLILP